MSTPDQVVAKFRAAAKDVETAQPPALNRLALTAKNAMLTAPGAPKGRMRGVGKNGARVGVRYTVTGKTARVKWFGPVHLVNNPTKAHDIRPKKRGKKRAIVVDGQPYAKARRPATRGKRFFQAGKAKAEREVPKQYYGDVTAPVRKQFG